MREDRTARCKAVVDNILSPQGYDEDVDKPPRSVVSEEAATLQKIL